MIKTKLSTFDAKTVSQQIVPRTFPIYAPGRVEAREQVRSRVITSQNNQFARGMIFIGLIIVMFTFCTVFNIKSHSEMNLEQQKQGVLNAEVQQMQEANMTLVEEINNLRNDPATIERAARQRLNMVRANERILIPAN